MIKMIKCAIFDADGTLIDSMSMWKNISYRYMETKGLTLPEGEHKVLNCLSLEQCAAYYLEHGVSGTREQVQQEIVACSLEGYRTGVGEKPHAAEFVRLLHENGVKIAVATASNREGVEAALERNGMLRYVDFLVTCTEIGKSKETPDIFLLCGAQFSANPEECVVFEDSVYALKTARAAGFFTVAIRDDIEGDEAFLEENIRKLKENADRYIEDYAALIAELSPLEEVVPGLEKAVRC